MVARVVAVLLSPVALVLAIVVPALAAGVWFASNPVPAATVTAAPASSSGDPLADTRKSLASTTLPLGLLSGGLAKLTDGGKQLDDGAHQLSDGLHQAKDGSGELADGMTQLREGVWALGDGSTKVSGGVDKVVDSLTGLGAVQGQVDLIVQQSIETLAASTDPAAKGAIDQLTTVQTMLRTQGLGGDVMNQLQELKTGARTLAYQLSDPKSEFVDGIVRATEGSAALRDGLVKLDDGGNRLVDGTGQLVDGTGPMAGVISGVQSDISDASASLPPANRIAADPTAPSTFVVRPALPDWPYMVSALLLVGAAVAVSLRVVRERFPVLVTAGIAVSAAVVLWFAQDDLTGGALAAAVVVLAVWAAALVAAGRAVIAVAGQWTGRIVLLVAAGVQLVVCGVAGAAFWQTGAHLASFLPLGQVVTALGEIAQSGAGVRTLVCAVVAGATIAVAQAVRSAHTSKVSAEESVPETRDEELASSVP
ncbi:hypothetical protein GCM10007304_15750 [Rhodococcoides trifolii]|uniref:X-X-X-Leu-X-X-Gly heptad repeat-containing protein n=1 Tax=Rhodococcoides trifolii TaxID=908250 RepID=A0A917CWV3_9NOCA|nr:hypothetical protein GCM10007304_15750 [Rhodococcus trifolii]